MKLAWFEMLIGALCFIIGFATFIVGVNPPNIIIILSGAFICTGMFFVMRMGWQMRKKILEKDKPKCQRVRFS